MQAQPVVAVRDWGEAMMASTTGALATLMGAIPRILGFVAIIVIGWFLATLIAKAVAALLRSIKFNYLAEQSGFTDFVKQMGLRTDAAGVIALAAKWFVRLIALVVAFDALGLPAVSDVLRQLLLWLPNLVVALVVLVVGGLAANALSRLVRGATAEGGFENPDALATVTRVAVWAFAIVVAVNQLGIATTLINTLLIGVVASIALSTGLAFGLGGREVAAQIVQNWYDQSGNAEAKLRRTAKAATRKASAELEQAEEERPRARTRS